MLNPPTTREKAIIKPFAEHLVEYPGANNMPFVDLTAVSHARGFYFGAHDNVARYKVIRLFERGKNGVSDVYAGLSHFPYVKPGESFEGSPVVLQFHDGDWVKAGREIYRPWFIDSFGLTSHEDDWMRQQSFYQMIMVMLPEGNINYRFKDIPQIARDGLQYGVTSLQIAGWQRGGHDNGYPYYEPDPRLGTYEDLEKAIAECHAMGVRVYFFVNIVVANLDTEWFKTELKDCLQESAQGAYIGVGWGMGTLASRMYLTVPLMTVIDTSFPTVAEGHLKYFRRLAQIGADGIHIDKLFPSALNFNPRSSFGPDQSGWEGAIRLVGNISKECRAIQPDFRMSYECNWDRLLQYAPNTWWAVNMSRAKEVFPELSEVIGLYQPYDYITLNNAVRNGYVIMVSPHHFTRTMACPSWRGLSEYIREVKVIRDKRADIYFYGELVPPEKGVLLDKEQLPEHLTWQTFRDIKTGHVGCILTNNGAETATVQVRGFANNTEPKVLVERPGGVTETVAIPATVTIPSERLIFMTAGNLQDDATQIVEPNVKPIQVEVAHTAEGPENSADQAGPLLRFDDGGRKDLPHSPVPPINLPDFKVEVLENDKYKVRIRRDTGAIIGLLDKLGGIEIIGEPRLASNFKFTLPIPGASAWQATEGNYIYGEVQSLSSVARGENSLDLHWMAPLRSVTDFKYDVDVTMRIALVADQVEFGLHIDNRTDLEIGEVFFPVLGGVTDFGRVEGGDAGLPRKTRMYAPTRDAGLITEPFQTFDNHYWLGLIGPEQFYSYPDKLVMPWIDLSHPDLNRGIYFGAHDPILCYKVLHLEQYPGIAGTRSVGNWPTSDESGELPVGVRISCVHMPYQRAGQPFDTATVVVKAHDGGWEKAARIHGAWAEQVLKPAAVEWVPHFLECQAKPFNSIPDQARRAKNAGLNALLLHNWQEHPEGVGIPAFQVAAGTDQALLSEAVAQCHAIGIRVILALDLEPVSRDSSLYSTEFESSVSQDRWEIQHSVLGWGKGETHSQRMATVEKRMMLNPGLPDLHQSLVNQTREIAKLGVDGLHLVRFFGMPMDFNPGSGRSPDRATWEGGIETLRDMLEVAHAENPRFICTSDNVFDSLACWTVVSGPPTAAMREAFPAWKPIIPVHTPENLQDARDSLEAGAGLLLAPAAGFEDLSNTRWQLLKNLTPGANTEP